MTSRLRRHGLLLSLYAAITLLSVLQRPGEVTFDTKLDLTEAPWAGLPGLERLWNPAVDFGSLGNQAYGYLFPQGAWFVALDQLVPDWLAQRLWSALLIVAACEGARRLARGLGLGRPHVALLAGLAYAVSPRLLGLSGALTGEILPTVVLPWTCLPLVLALRGRLAPRTAGLLAGCSVLFMGGINAVENLAALLLPLCLVLSGLATSAGRRLLAWWAAATTLASLWWMAPLIVMGRHSPPFLDYIETAAATTRVTGWSNSVRGAEHWVNYIFVGGGPFWPGAYELSTDRGLVLVAAVLAAVGLIGLVHPSMPMRGPLALSALTGLALLTVGHGGPAGSPIAPWVRDLLDGPLAPFRNVHKVDPAIRLPLALGTAHAVRLLAVWVARRRPRAVGGQVRTAVLPSVVVAVLLVVTAAPLAMGGLRHRGWEQVPDGWREAVAHLEAHDDGGAVLVAPATAFGMQRWGWTVDEPIQALYDRDWVARTQIPLVPTATIRWMDGIEARLETGVGSPRLADTLSAAGVTRILVRRDIDLAAADVADPNRVDLALSNSPGLVLEESFGRSGFGDQALIDVYRVQAPAAEIGAQPVDGTQLLVGAPEDVMTAREADVVPAGAHVVVGPGGEGVVPDVVTDGYRRQERQFGRFHDAVGEVLTASAPYRGGRREPDYAGVDGVPKVTAVFDGVEDVSASSSSGYSDTVGPVRPELGPASAVDGAVATAWRSAPFEDSVGQWVELDLGTARDIGLVQVHAGVDGLAAAPVREVEIRAGGQTRAVRINAISGLGAANLDGVNARHVRVTVTRIAGDVPFASVELREIEVEGVHVSRRLRVPDVGATGSTTFVFSARPPVRACVPTILGPVCDQTSFRPSDEAAGLARELELDGAGEWTVSGQVDALPTEETISLLDGLGPASLRARADSVLVSDPAVAPAMAVDGDPGTPWLANVGELSPTLDLSWGRERRLTRLSVDSAPVDAVRPFRATIRGAGETRVVDLGPDSLGTFRPLVASEVSIRFQARSIPGQETVPVGLGEVRLEGIADLSRRLDPDAPTGSVCGLGPEVRIDGRTHATAVRGTVGDVLEGRPLTWRSCDGPVTLEEGLHVVVATPTTQFQPTRLLLTPRGALPRETTVRDVQATVGPSAIRTWTVAAGEAAYLATGQNANDGWRAELDGRALEPAVLDGWQQAFVIPEATRPGIVRLTYQPDVAYRASLLVGLGAAALLVVGTFVDLVLGRRRRRRVTPVLGPARVVRRSGRRRLVGLTLAWLALTVLGGLVAGGAALLAAALGASEPRRRLLLGVGGILVVASGVVAGYSDRLFAGQVSAAADLVAALGVGVLGGLLLRGQDKEAVR